jgi:hypothetical protein
MKIQGLKFLTAVLAIFVSGVLGASDRDALNQAIKCDPITTDLANALVRVALLSHVPIIAELAQPVPAVDLSQGTYIVKDLLDGIARQSPGYEWRVEGRAVHFYSRRTKDAKSNFLNLRFPEFTMPGSLSDLKLMFPGREYALFEGSPGGSMIIEGFGDPVLKGDTLQATPLENVTGREILFRAANERPTFATVLIFPNDDPTKKQVEMDMNRNWFWQALSAPSPAPLYVDPPKDGRAGPPAVSE